MSEISYGHTCTGQTVSVNQSLATPRHISELAVTDKYIFISSGVTHRYPLFLLKTLLLNKIRMSGELTGLDSLREQSQIQLV